MLAAPTSDVERLGWVSAGPASRRPKTPTAGDRRLVDNRVAQHGAAGRDARHARLLVPAGAHLVMQSDMGWQYQSARAARRGFRAEHVTQGKLPGQRLRRGAVRAHEGRVLPGPRLERLRVVQSGFGGLHSPPEHAPQAEEAERTNTGGIPEPGLDGSIAASFY